MASQGTADVTVRAGANMTKTTDSGAEVQNGLRGATANVVYTADSGYYFPENYNQDASMNQNGITVVRNSNTQIIVSGTPEDNTNITLGDAEKKETSVYAIAVNPDKLTFGSVNEGHTQPWERTVTITNTGNRPVTLHQPTWDDASARILLLLLIISLGGLFTAVWYKMKKRKRQ